MARLRFDEGTPVRVVRDGFTVGRRSGADHRLDDDTVSGVHAVFRWTGHRWELRDLSTNGTWLDEQRLPPGEAVALRVGAVLRFGESRATVVDLTPPEPVAWLGERAIEGTSGHLALPDSDAPLASVWFDEGSWWLDGPEGRRVVADGESIRVGASAVRLELPPLHGTARTQQARTLDQLRGTLVVSMDEESVRWVVSDGAESHDLGIRAHHYLLVVLLRQRLADAHLPESERGWLDGEHLCRDLGVSDNLLYTHIFRCRRALSQLQIRDADQVVERRGSGQLRLGPLSLSLSQTV